MKADEQIVRTVNHCLDLHRLYRLLTVAEWNRFVDLVMGGSLIFSGEPTGFHLLNNDETATDCASIETTMRSDYFTEGAWQAFKQLEVK